MVDSPSGNLTVLTERNRYNWDQVGLAILFGLDKTWDFVGSEHVPLAACPGSHKDARECTIMMGLPVDPWHGHFPHWELAFRGTGKKISNEERLQYDPDVRVKFQKKAFYDDALCLDFATTTMQDHHLKYHKDEDTLCVLDNLSGHKTPAFVAVLESFGSNLLSLMPV